ncbi:hypothetical protein NUSPORA_02564 [Nucleospora cyclopteri]
MSDQGQQQSAKNFDIFNIMLLQDCSLILYQHTNILQTEKKFNNKEISNRIIPYYYYTTIIAIPVLFPILKALEMKYIQLLIVICPLIVLFIVIYMPVRNSKSGNSFLSLFMAQASYSVGSVGECLRSISRSVTVPSKNKTRESSQFILYKFKSDFAKSLAAWISQDIFFETGSYSLIYLVSFLFYSSSLGFVIYNILWGETVLKGDKGFASIYDFINQTKSTFRALTKKQRINLLLQVSNNTFRIFLALFVSTILSDIKNKQLLIQRDVEKMKEKIKKLRGIDKEDKIINKWVVHNKTRKNFKSIKTGGLHFINMFFSNLFEYANFIIYCIIHLITVILVKITFTTKKGSADDRAQKRKTVLGTGYIVGIIKISSTLVAYVITANYIKKAMFFNYLFYSHCVPVILLVFLAACNTIFTAQAVYFLIMVTLMINKAFLRDTFNTYPNPTLFACFTPFSVSLMSTLINFMCSVLNLSVKKKCSIYTIIGCMIYLIALGIRNSNIWECNE